MFYEAGAVTQGSETNSSQPSPIHEIRIQILVKLLSPLQHSTLETKSRIRSMKLLMVHLADMFTVCALDQILGKLLESLHEKT